MNERIKRYESQRNATEARKAYQRERSRKYRAEHPGPTNPAPTYALICVECGQPFTAKNRRLKRCSDGCIKLRACNASRMRNAARKQLVARECSGCGKVFTPEYGNKHRTFCSFPCAKRESRKVTKHVRRARLRGSSGGTVYRRHIFNRDGWVCGLCGGKVKRKALVPDPMAATLDHIIPISAGGVHAPHNLQCAHFICNSRKGAKPVGQLRLAIEG